MLGLLADDWAVSAMFEFVDILLQKRRLVVAGAALLSYLLLISFLAPTVQAHQASLAARIHNSSYTAQNAQPNYSSPNEVTNAVATMAGGVGQSKNFLEIHLLSAAIATASSVTHFDRSVGHGAASVVGVSVHGAMATTGFMVRTSSAEFVFTGHVLDGGFALMGHAVGGGFAFTGHTIGGSLAFVGHGVGKVFSPLSGISHVSAVIQPADPTPTPIITQLRARQAALIQSGTMEVLVSSMNVGTGGACDSGQGNGYYPLIWCKAPMDSTPTVPYSNDPINRECTSYAYWYFTSVEGHSNFHVTGNAKYWASTSNYPTHPAPVVGAIAVETTGAYGHVAIVRALPGQSFAGRAVPAGYVLVSEMNYDWNGHFRYSYSPLGKFSSYIYP